MKNGPRNDGRKGRRTTVSYRSTRRFARSQPGSGCSHSALLSHNSVALRPPPGRILPTGRGYRPFLVWWTFPLAASCPVGTFLSRTSAKQFQQMPPGCIPVFTPAFCSIPHLCRTTPPPLFYHHGFERFTFLVRRFYHLYACRRAPWHALNAHEKLPFVRRAFTAATRLFSAGTNGDARARNYHLVNGNGQLFGWRTPSPLYALRHGPSLHTGGRGGRFSAWWAPVLTTICGTTSVFCC